MKVAKMLITRLANILDFLFGSRYLGHFQGELKNGAGKCQ
jgi:hypothetical protein